MNRHWYVLGTGAIGSLFASALAQGGSRVSLLTRPGANKPENPVRLRIGGLSTGISKSLFTSSPESDDAIQHLLVTTKAYDVETGIAAIAHRLTDNCQIVLLVNGMGLAEKLSARYPGISLFLATTTEGAYREPGGTVIHAGRGHTRLGGVDDADAPSWFADWRNLTLTCEWERHITSAMWQKLAINCAINPMTATENCRNGELLANSMLSARLQALCDEIASILQAAGHEEIAANLWQRVSEVVRGTADNRSSMLQDVASGKPTEIEHITGYLLAIAEELNIPAPLNRQLLEQVRAQEKHAQSYNS